jgi:hypothetical protein
MLTIQNIKNIEGKEFQLSNGTRFLIGLVRDDGLHYTFGVFRLHENNVPSIKDAIIYKLHRALLNRRGYELTSAKLKQNVYVKPANLTLKNFILELHIQTAKVCSQ